MTCEYVNHAARCPRYTPAPPKVRVTIEQTIGGQPSQVLAELVNLSRSGYQVKTPAPLDADEPLTMRLFIEGTGVHMALPGAVRWQRLAPDGAWLSGCMANCLMPWEVLGELFLNNVLSTDGP